MVSNHPDSTEENPVSDGKDYPYIFIPPGNLLKRGSHDDGAKVDISDISFTTDLKPIPFKIHLEEDLVDTFKDLLLDGLSEVDDAALTLGFGLLNKKIAALLGLDWETEICPPLGAEGVDDFFKYFNSEFNGLIPGTIGAQFQLMENDEFSEGLVKDLQDSIRKEVEKSINSTINDISFSNLLPNPENFKDEVLSAETVKTELTGPVIVEFFKDYGLYVLGTVTLNVPLAIYGFFQTLTWAFGPLDDVVGSYGVAYTHTDLQEALEKALADAGIEIPDIIEPELLPDTEIPFDSEEIKRDGNVWKINGTIKVNQIALPVDLRRR
jgi:hypothetical protein